MPSALTCPLNFQLPGAPTRAGAQPGGFRGRTPARPLALLGILALHAVLVWGLLQSRGVQQVLLQAQPLVVMLLSERAAPAERHARPALTLLPPAPPAPSLPRPLPVPEVVLPARNVVSPLVPNWSPAAPAVAEAAPPRAATAVTDPAPPTPAPAPQPPPAAATQRQLPTAAIQFSEAPVVVYPRLSRRNGESGRVIVRAYVDATGGAPRNVQVAQSCGHPRLDEAALAAVQKARFKPTIDNGQAVAGWALIPIDFELEAAR
jgi:protein TonB